MTILLTNLIILEGMDKISTPFYSVFLPIRLVSVIYPKNWCFSTYLLHFYTSSKALLGRAVSGPAKVNF